MEHNLWINWNNRVISFSAENGFEKLHFQTHEEKMKFALEKGNEGFGLQ